MEILTKEYTLNELMLMQNENTYSYADYLLWTFQERVEIIKGKLFNMSPAPRRVHQKIHSIIFTDIAVSLKGKACEIYSAPFDVRFPNQAKDSDDQTYTVVQPDICVICDLEKLDDAGCIGAPNLIVEILSSATASKDLNEKFDLYEEHGVQEYWLVYPGESVLEIYDLKEGKYSSRGKFVREDTVTSNVIKGLEIKLKEVFEE